MSLIVKTTDGSVWTNFVGIPIEGVAIGSHEIPLDHFCCMAEHFLGGGWFGWGKETPECVSVTLSHLFELYEKTKDGKWIRRGI